MNKLHRAVARVCAAALLTTGVVAVASTSVATAATSASTNAVTVYLTPPDPAGLQALSEATGLTREERLSRLNALLPDPTPVISRLTSLGLTVTRQDPWSVTAQAPASTIASLFGTVPSLSSLVGATTAQIRAATSSLPLLPSVLNGLVTAVVPTTGPAVQQAHAAAGGTSYTGAQIRAAYNLPYDGSSAAPAQYARGVTPTVASIQFSTDPTLMNDLAQVGTVRPGQIQQVTVSDPADTSGAAEVALDQEALLTVAPGVNQRIYYAANTPDMGPAFQAVLTDVRGGRSDIVALTTSWGRCESSVDPSMLAATNTILQSLVASGVTVFAASGDSGIYDCNTPPNSSLCPVLCTGPSVDVDFPASSPAVVSVGATNLAPGSSTETAWSCTSGAGSSLFSPVGDCYAPPAGNGGGSGGGASTYFGMPDYQQSTLLATYKSSTKRLVPDIAAVGDPATGFDAVVNGTHATIGGTSLSAPVSAALLAAMLGHYGATTGVGDVHPWLYKVLATGSAAPNLYGRDVTSNNGPGTNGAAADKSPNDPSVSATLGYDTVTGLGSVFWDAFKFNALPTAPQVTGTMKAAGSNIQAQWTASTGRLGSALSTVDVTVISNGATVFKATGAAASGEAVFTGTPGANYTMVVSTSDLVGHPASFTYRYTMPFSAPTGPAVVSGSGVTNIDDALLKAPGWKRVKTKGAFGGKVLTTSTKGRKATITITAQTITLSYLAGPSNGRLTVVVDGQRIVIDEYSKRAMRKSITIVTGPTPGKHAVQLIASGTRNPHSHGRAVDVDFLTAYLP